ncbi:helix-turn-helix transcriptional regulator [Alcaligenes faecalis]|uniref:helix-turn-helix transcriptional regulator n=1 Tax=Alcaligenes faecalis TaxID=511 RepID=UPI001EF130A0|nr:AlpA family phage regulatory protein [Alcaligenes faecalis]ULH06433.1 AlpA family transcriptional regulator [Alcaligenes faecalis]
MSHSKASASFGQNAEPAFYRLADIIRITALSRSSIYRRIATGDFPPQVSLGGRAKGWRREDLQAWISDPSGYRPLTSCHVQHGSAGGRVRRVAANTAPN